MCFDCKKPGHFKEDFLRLKKQLEAKEKLKKKSSWKNKKSKKALKATWSDLNDDEKIQLVSPKG